MNRKARQELLGIVTGPVLLSDYAAWTPREKLVGLLPAALVQGIHTAVGTAGGVLVGLFALSALGILTMGWHPLVALRARDAGSGMRDAGSGMREVLKASARAPEVDVAAHPASRISKERKGRGERAHPASPIPH